MVRLEALGQRANRSGVFPSDSLRPSGQATVEVLWLATACTPPSHVAAAAYELVRMWTLALHARSTRDPQRELYALATVTSCDSATSTAG